MTPITYCIPTKNNRRYLKNCVRSIQENAPASEIFIFIDSDNDGTEEWIKTLSGSHNVHYAKNHSKKTEGIAAGYNECVRQSANDIVCMFHADMFMGPGFEEGILKQLKPKTIVSATRIEPPLHPPGKEKIVQNFGFYPEDFQEAAFKTYVSHMPKEGKTTNGIFAPWVCYKKDMLDIGMHDEYFHSYHEDTDIFQRFLLNGCQTIQTWDSFVYHLTCRGGQFQDGIEKVTADADFHIMKQRAFRHFLRKWGSSIRNDEYCHPILPHKYNIGFVVQHADPHIIEMLEPLCDTLYTDFDAKDYIAREQPNCYYTLRDRIRPIYSEPDNDVVVSFDVADFNGKNASFLFNILPDVLTETNDVGDFEYDIFKISIRKFRCLNDSLIVIGV